MIRLAYIGVDKTSKKAYDISRVNQGGNHDDPQHVRVLLWPVSVWIHGLFALRSMISEETHGGPSGHGQAAFFILN